MSKSIFNLGSITYATKAKMILAQYSIEARIVKLSNENAGCIHGIEFDHKSKNNVQQILSKHRILFKETSP